MPVQLAAGGRAIVTTIHQPSSRLYRQLDAVLLLAEGHALYCGDAQLVSVCNSGCASRGVCISMVHRPLDAVLLLPWRRGTPCTAGARS